MNKPVKNLSLVFAAAICISLTACSSESGETNDSKGKSTDSSDLLPYETDTNGTVTRNGEQIDVCVCHDRKSVYLYYNDENHELFDKARLPTDEIYDKAWKLGVADFDDINGDSNSDLQVCLSHADMSESHIVWEWDKDEGYVFQPDSSQFYNPIVVINPPEDAVIDFSIYEGLWQSDEENLYPDTYLQFDAEGNWELSSGGEEIDNGNLGYVSEEGLTYVYSSRDGAIDGGSNGAQSVSSFNQDDYVVGNDWRVTGIVRDGGTITRSGEDTYVLVCVHSADAAFYYDTEEQVLFGSVDYPVPLEGDPWEVFWSIDFADLDGDGNSDVTMKFDDKGSELLMVWYWDAANEQFMYQPDEKKTG